MAAVGLNILLYIDSQPAFGGGTSASAPIFSSIITLINEQRLTAGKSTVGFLNPTLYQNPDAFTDVSSFVFSNEVEVLLNTQTDHHWKQPWLQHSGLQCSPWMGYVFLERSFQHFADAKFHVDPVTGLGTPVFSKLLDVFMALP